MIRKSLPLIFILVAVGLFYTYIDPLYEEIKELKVEEAQFDEALVRSREFLKLRDELLTRYSTLPENDLERLKKLLPDNVDNVRLILDIDSIASAHNLHVQNFTAAGGSRRNVSTIGPSSSSPQYESFRLSFSVISNYKTLLSFLADLERSLRIVDVVDFSFNEQKGDLSEYKVTLETYWLQ